jgi:hypothetical protein
LPGDDIGAADLAGGLQPVAAIAAESLAIGDGTAASRTIGHAATVAAIASSGERIAHPTGSDVTELSAPGPNLAVLARLAYSCRSQRPPVTVELARWSKVPHSGRPAQVT